jgi:hypothetical protein
MAANLETRMTLRGVALERMTTETEIWIAVSLATKRSPFHEAVTTALEVEECISFTVLSWGRSIWFFCRLCDSWCYFFSLICSNLYFTIYLLFLYSRNDLLLFVFWKQWYNMFEQKLN